MSGEIVRPGEGSPNDLIRLSGIAHYLRAQRIPFDAGFLDGIAAELGTLRRVAQAARPVVDCTAPDIATEISRLRDALDGVK